MRYERTENREKYDSRAIFKTRCGQVSAFVRRSWAFVRWASVVGEQLFAPRMKPCQDSPPSYLHLSLNRGGRWGTTYDFTTSFLHFSLFSTALWDLANSRPVHSLMLSSHLFFCLPCLLPPFTVPCKMVLARPDKRET